MSGGNPTCQYGNRITADCLLTTADDGSDTLRRDNGGAPPAPTTPHCCVSGGDSPVHSLVRVGFPIHTTHRDRCVPRQDCYSSGSTSLSGDDTRARRAVCQADFSSSGSCPCEDQIRTVTGEETEEYAPHCQFTQLEPATDVQQLRDHIED